MKLLPSFQTTFLCLLLTIFTFQVSAQTTIVKNEFISVNSAPSVSSNQYQGVQSITPTLQGDDSWGFTTYVDNGTSNYSNDKYSSSPRSLMLSDWWSGKEYIEFEEVDISTDIDVEFSIMYASNSGLSANDRLDLIYYIDNTPTTVTLIEGGNGTVDFGSSNNNGTSQPNTYTLSIPDSASIFKFTIEFITDNGGGESIYIDDVFLTTNSGTGSGTGGSVSPTYCTPINVGSNNQFYISNVSFGNINNSSDNSADNYEYYTTPTTDVIIGDDYAMVVDFVTNSYNTTGLVVWIDFNNDGDFYDANEKVYSATNTPTINTGSHVFSVTVPSTATLGATRMRLALKHNDPSSTSCTNDYEKGEFEDYTIFVAEPEVNYCEPALSNNSNNQYNISNVLIADIDNSSTNSADEYEYYTTPTTDLVAGDVYSMEVDFNKKNNKTSVVVVWMDFNNDGDFEDSGEQVYSEITGSGSSSGTHAFNVSIPITATLGDTRMRLVIEEGNTTGACDNIGKGEVEDYTINIVAAVVTIPRIQISGNSTIITNNDDTPSATDDTHFGTVDVGLSQTNTYTIENTGTGDLSINSILLNPTAPTTTQFVVVNNPTPVTLVAGASTTFQVMFTPTSESTENATVVVSSSDTVTPSYQFEISGDADQKFYDSDNDGVYDNIDIDDDNDGILDVDEQNDCAASAFVTTTNYKFLNETFGVGPGRGNAISTLYDASTTYCLEAGTASPNTADCPDLNNPSLNDGEYTINHKITSGVNGEVVGPNNNDAIASWAHSVWANIKDHTPDDADNDDSAFGNMAIFNASSTPGIFYETTITGTLPGVSVSYSFWAMNIDNKYSDLGSGDTNGGTRIKPNITVKFLKTDGTLISEYETGDIDRCAGDNNCDLSEWQLFEPATISTDESEFIVQFINNSPGGLGNDLAIDDIKIQQTLCDYDGDGIANVFDLDSDNDGIPDAVEAGFGAHTNGTAHVGVAWIDINKDGLHDALVGTSVLDSDGDGVPNYLDLDSDNDGLFDVDESGMGNTNSADVNYVNGDGDVSGDGVGQGLDTEEFREKDTDGDGNIEYFGDGILDVFDFLEGTTYATSYGNNGQISGGYLVVDSDGDGVPDYLDTTSNGSAGGFDITASLYVNLDADNDGVIDDGQAGNFIDSDGDSVSDSRDGDDAAFGSPRDLDDSYSLYFDGRNDYVEADNALNNTDATIMAFVKTEGVNTLGDGQFIAGQNNFFIRISPNNKVIARIDGTNIDGNFITQNVWTHIAATTTTGKTRLYINGVEVVSADFGSIVNDTSMFRIGARSNNSIYFKGEIDEVRVFDRVLTPLEIKHMIHQELDENESFNKGKIIPKTIGALNSNLIRYYKMDGYQDDILDDKKTFPTEVDKFVGAKLYNIKDIYFQTAPLPYVTESDGDWTNQTSWLHGDIWDITTKVSNEDDASIVHVKHNLNTSDTQGMVGLLVDENKEFSIKTDKALYNSWYLKLDGFIDLEGESQLIQKEDSDLYNGTNAKLERDQQGTVNLYTYNYWSSPVHTSVSSSPVNGSENFSVADVLYDGTDATSPAAISYVEGYDGDTSPMKISNYWLWKFDNYLDDNYADWQSITSSSRLNTGVGYTMKGTSTDAITGYQNYIFAGKPNNGTVKLNLSSGNNYLVGNPYPSAIDGYEFIVDNEDVITGTLYFWEHYGGDSHILAEYQGGYGLYNLSGGVPAIADLDVQQATPDDDVSSLGTPTKTPRQYIPVAQGFFVVAQDGGDVTFENDQRIFVKEGATNNDSWFFRQDIESDENEVVEENNTQLTDDRPKFRIDFVSPNNYWRQLLLTVDENTTPGIDWAYDGAVNEENAEDMLWRINDKDFIIQAVAETTPSTILPLSVKTLNGGEIKIHIHDLENVPLTTQVYLKDNEIYHDLRASEYITTVHPGTTLDRFKIVFSLDKTLSVQGNLVEQSIVAYYNNQTRAIEISNMKNEMVNLITVFNLLGQKITEKTIHSNQQKMILPLAINTGVYIFKITTDTREISHKILINSN